MNENYYKTYYDIVPFLDKLEQISKNFKGLKELVVPTQAVSDFL